MRQIRRQVMGCILGIMDGHIMVILKMIFVMVMDNAMGKMEYKGNWENGEQIGHKESKYGENRYGEDRYRGEYT